MEDYLTNIFKDIKLDEHQKKAILDESKYQMIIAGAGSGKTTTIAAKVKYLVDIKKVEPEEILLISFTNKAVFELKSKIEKEFEIETNVLTFHKLALLILRDVGFNYQVMSDTSLVFKQFLTEYIKNNGVGKTYKIVSKYVSRKALRVKNLEMEQFLKLKDVIEQINYFYDGRKLKINNKHKKFIAFAGMYKEYLNAYLDKHHLIDFQNMIVKAKDNIFRCGLNYKYIIVDEYQDISEERYELLTSLVKKTDSNLIVVGDDWQAIFAFAGSNINLFMHFQKQMHATCNKIINTYRNSQELINIAGSFVMKDEQQIKKQLKSNKHLKNPIYILYYDNDWDKVDILYFLIKKLYSKNPHDKILLLGRYKFDISFLNHSKYFKVINDDIVYVESLNLNLTYLTIHSAKGLGFDQVILLNMEHGEYGFPSLKKDDKLLKIIKDYDSKEERRLFYVALTRTKNHVFLFVPKAKFSSFITEIKGMKGVEVIKKSDL